MTHTTPRPWLIVMHNGLADIFTEDGKAIVIMVEENKAKEIVEDHNRAALLDEAKAALQGVMKWADLPAKERKHNVDWLVKVQAVLAKLDGGK